MDGKILLLSFNPHWMVPDAHVGLLTVNYLKQFPQDEEYDFIR